MKNNINKTLKDFKDLQNKLSKTQQMLIKQIKDFPYMKIMKVNFEEDFYMIDRIYRTEYIGVDPTTGDLMVKAKNGYFFPVENIELLTKAQAENIQGKDNVIYLSEYLKKKNMAA